MPGKMFIKTFNKYTWLNTISSSASLKFKRKRVDISTHFSLDFYKFTTIYHIWFFTWHDKDFGPFSIIITVMCDDVYVCMYLKYDWRK